MVVEGVAGTVVVSRVTGGNPTENVYTVVVGVVVAVVIVSEITFGFNRI